MILHTIIPLEAVMGDYSRESENASIEMDYMGERIIAMHTVDNRYVITRLISTSLKAYLNPQLQPGAVIKGRQASRQW